MSRRPNWKHYHLERNGNRLNSREQRYRAAWELVARLAKTDPESTWRVVECLNSMCHSIPARAIAYKNGNLGRPISVDGGLEG